MITIPKLKDLYSNIITDIEVEYDSQIPRFGKAFLRAFAAVQAGKLWLFYKGLGFIQRNIFPDSADPQSKGGTLERFGLIKLGRNRFSSTAGEYEVQVTGVNGAVIPALTTFKSNDDSQNPGKLFILDSEFTMTMTLNTITLRALEGGTDSQLTVGDKVTATAPIPQVDKEAEVLTESVTPLSEEDIEDYRTLILNSFRLEPQGGAGSDYRLWAADAQGVKNSYPYATPGLPGEIDIYIEANIDDSSDGKGTPTAAILSEVEDVIEFDPDDTKPLSERGRRPLGVFDVHVMAVTIVNVDITIDSFTGLTATIQTLIENSLESEINTVRPFIDSVDIVADKNNILDINKIINVILSAQPGSVFGTVTMDIDSSPLSTYTFDNGEIPYLNSVSFT